MIRREEYLSANIFTIGGEKLADAYIYICCLILIGYSVYAQEDENIDDIVNVEGEEGSIVADEETEEDTSNASADADTTILFTRPIHSAASSLGTFAVLLDIGIRG